VSSRRRLGGQTGSVGARFSRSVNDSPEDHGAPEVEVGRPADPPPHGREWLGQTGARFARGAPTDPPLPAAEAATNDPAFDLVFRGFDRGQVEAALGRQTQVIEELQAKLDAAEQMMRQTTQQLRALETERASSPDDRGSPAPSGFGPRVERLLRMAESEAADLRSRAVRDATELMERSRAEAELHRHAVEQALIARVGELEELTARRNAECQEREDQVARRLSDAQAEADRITAAAAREAERLRHEMAAAAEVLSRSIRAEADQLRAQARQDVGRLTEVRAATWFEIERIAEWIGAELARDQDTAGARPAATTNA
jgi:cell division septum initiation protein DivIVA